MKKHYTTPEVKEILVSVEDVIVTSGLLGDDINSNPGGSQSWIEG